MLHKKSSIPEIVNLLDVDNLHVYAPTDAILVCGGEVNAKSEYPISFRDAYIKGKGGSELEKFAVHLPEDTNIHKNFTSFHDWLDFETYAAEICQLVILFCESPGSFSELGSFAVLNEISSRLLVFIDNDSYEKESYINLGPCASIVKRHGKDRIYVLDLKTLTMVSSRDYKSVNPKKLISLIGSHINNWISSNRHSQTFDSNLEGHLIKLVTGLVQHYGALEVEEIEVLLYCLGISKNQTEVQKYLDCACFVEWVKRERRGVRDFYVPLQEKDAIEYVYGIDELALSKSKWRANVRSYWKKHDGERHMAITANRLRSAS